MTGCRKLKYYFPDLIEEVAKCEETFPDKEGAYTFGSDLLAFKIAKALVPSLEAIGPDSDHDLKQEIDFLYGRAIKFSPYRPIFSVEQGIFYLKIEKFDDAVTSFRRAYELNKVSTIEKWPHLQKTEFNQMLYGYLCYAISHSTSANPRPPEPR